LELEAARKLALHWWTAKEVKQVFPDEAAITQFFEWHDQFQLGRKRLLETMLAATYWKAGVSSILTLDFNDFMIFGVFKGPSSSPGPAERSQSP
jgi:hypothetical protein